MVFNKSKFLLLLQYLVIISGQAFFGHNHPFRHSIQTNRAALLAFKRSISSNPYFVLFNWNEATHVYNFTGVRCIKQHHRVVELVLRDAELVGKLSPFIANLTRLRFLQLVNNNFFGIIPLEFSSLQHLSNLWLKGNNVEGQIPKSFSLLTNLAFVNLQANKLTGEIPTEIGNFLGLWNLTLYNNQFTGEIPFSITNASLMYSLDVEDNHLKGELPSEIVANLPELSYLYLSYNDMVSHDNNSNLVSFFTSLKNCMILDELELASMDLGGRLPTSIGQLVGNLTSLLLQENKIKGSIPPTLVNLTQLTVLNLTYNLLSGTIPTKINFLLDLNHNLFTGVIPPSLGQCTDISKLDLSYNKLTGNIPPEISGLQEIRIFLNLSHNHLEGPLPIELRKLENVQEIDLSSNNLTGSIFPYISSCIALSMINFSHNFLQGELLETLGDLNILETFDVSRNFLSRTIPTSIYKIYKITFLNLSFNNFTGIIPFGGIFNSVTSIISRQPASLWVSSRHPHLPSKPTLSSFPLIGCFRVFDIHITNGMIEFSSIFVFSSNKECLAIVNVI
ncbi:hypothetical protein ACSBR2_028706 [Camellia fascicularis]